MDICNQEKPTIAPENLQTLIADARQIPGFNKNLLNVAEQVYKNTRIFNLADKISRALENYEVDILEQCIKEVEQYSVKGIEIDLLEKAEQMLEEAHDNPNFLAEKQAELKKQGKKGNK